MPLLAGQRLFYKTAVDPPKTPGWIGSQVCLPGRKRAVQSPFSHHFLPGKDNCRGFQWKTGLTSLLLSFTAASAGGSEHLLRLPILHPPLLLSPEISQTGGHSRTVLRWTQPRLSGRFSRLSLITFCRAKITVVDFNGKRASLHSSFRCAVAWVAEAMGTAA
jgi:hypothetical protein